MATKGKIEREKNIRRLYENHKEKIQEAVKSYRTGDLTIEERQEVMMYLNKVRRYNPTRFRNRCNITGESRGYRGYFGLSQSMLKNLARNSKLPGVTRRTW